MPLPVPPEIVVPDFQVVHVAAKPFATALMSAASAGCSAPWFCFSFDGSAAAPITVSSVPPVIAESPALVPPLIGCD